MEDLDFSLLEEALLEPEFSEDPNLISASVLRSALEIGDLFPSGILEVLGDDKDVVRLSGNKQRCLLAHCLLCTLKGGGNATGGEKDEEKQELTFRRWLGRRKNTRSDPTDNSKKMYLKCLLRYFSSQTEEKSLEFALKSLSSAPSWEESNAALDATGLELRSSAVIGDYEAKEGECVAMVDFANAFPGFGPGFTQEELLLGTRPGAW